MPRSKYTKNNFTLCNCGTSNFNNYFNKVFSLNIDFFNKDGAGYISSWQLYNSDGIVAIGHTQDEFINYLKRMIVKHELEIYTSSTRDKIIIYIDNVMKILGFFNKYITCTFSDISVTLLNHFEFRSYRYFDKTISNIDAAKFMQKIVDEIMVKEKYFYLTPNQRTRKILKKECKKENNNIAKEIFPESAQEYVSLREALYGGICYCPLPNIVKEVPMIELDIKSAYIYSLLTQKFPIKKVEAKPENWEFYLNNSVEHSLGIYKINYTTASNILHCFKYYANGKAINLKSGQNIEVILTLNSIDLSLLFSIPKVYINSVECLYLEAYETDYLPKYVRDRLIYEFIEKNKINEDENPELYMIQKVILNGIYGNMIKKFNLDNFKSEKNNAYLAPQWGIWCTSYTKKHLLGLALQVEGWMYSDTDSIYCYDTAENNAKVESYNAKTLSIIRDFCDNYDANFSELRELGKFELKHRIKKFKALCQKEYMYTTIDNKLIVKAAGCSKEEMPLVDTLYYYDKLPIGTKTFGFVTDKTTECEYNGKHYKSEGSYYEIKLKNDDARLMMYAIDKIQGDDYDA